MDSNTEKIDLYKLDSVFHEDTVVHSTGLVAGTRVPLKTTWKREKLLGSGAFGSVWREKEDESGKLRAVKVISKLNLNVREVEALVALQDHPSLFVIFLGWFQDPYAIHIAMEYIEHGDLGEYIRDHGATAEEEAKQIATQILKGLVVLHEREICHRDLKPQNILIVRPSPIWVKISDFGISKQALGTSLRSGCGTLSYQSPEQLGLLPKGLRPGGSYSKAVDLWALGAVIHEILTTEIPFLERYEDMETLSPELYTATDFPPTIDSEILFGYCRGDDFPIKILRKNGVSEEGINLVKGLMVANPRGRVCAAVALTSRWFFDLDIQIQLLAVHFDDQRMTPIPDGLVNDQILAMLTTAVSVGCIEVVQNLLKEIDDVNSSSAHEHMTLLQLAACNGQLEVLKLLFDSGADLDGYSKGENGQTALYGAAASGQLDAIKLLLDMGAKINNYSKSENGQTALHGAAASGQLDAIKLLVDMGADIEGVPATENGQTALHGAAARGQLAVITLLADMGVDINGASACKNGQTSLHGAAANGQLDAIKLLVDKGANINSASLSENGQTALHGAAASGQLDAIKLLADMGADIEGVPATENGQTALHGAAARGQLAVITLLADMGVDINGASACKNGQTSLHGAAANGQLDAIKLLVDKGANINGDPVSENGQSALHGAAASGQLEAIKLLLHMGANINSSAKCKNGQTSLHGAAASGQLDAIKLLVDMGATIDWSSGNENGQCAIHGAAASGQLDAIKLLVGMGVTLNAYAKTKNGQTALHGAAANGQHDAMEQLLDSGASVSGTPKTKSDRPPLHAAATRGDLKATKLLLSRGAKIGNLLLTEALNPDIIALLKARQKWDLT